MAEAQGFEPWVPCGTSVFKTGAINQTLPNFRIFGTGTRIRTQDTRFWRPLLYQLSYTDAIGFPATLGASHLGRCFTLGQLLTERS